MNADPRLPEIAPQSRHRAGTHYVGRHRGDGVRANHGLANSWIRPRRDAPAISMAFSFAGVVSASSSRREDSRRRRWTSG